MWETLLNGVDLVRALLIMQGYVSGPKVDRLVGWLPGSASQILGGLANKIPGDRAWVEQRKDPNEWRATLAHELGHTYGLKHNSLKTNDYHWFDVYERSIKPEMSYLGLADFMYLPPTMAEKNTLATSPVPPRRHSFSFFLHKSEMCRGYYAENKRCRQ